MNGVTWRTKAVVMLISVVSLISGSSLVHQYYKPLDDIEEYIEREIQSRKANR